ncbi:hypothetical protein E9993_04460 [Labilibacter sediminis]|nr:hypothetical protein E9993_04460 [Labilibacter sediminis]
MKRFGLLTGMLLMVVLGFAQVKQLAETLVEAPKFNCETAISGETGKAPICNYLSETLSDGQYYDEGLVIVLFTIETDGTLSEFSVENSVSKSTDNAVISCLQSTNGMWSPGLVNGNPVDMQKKIYVRFLNPEHESLEQLAQDKINMAIRKYHAAVQIQNSFNLHAETASKRSERKFNTALNLLENANKYQPGEPAVAFWQACAYEKLGNEMMKDQKINEFIDLVDNNYQAQIDGVEIVLK